MMVRMSKIQIRIKSNLLDLWQIKANQIINDKYTSQINQFKSVTFFRQTKSNQINFCPFQFGMDKNWSKRKDFSIIL